MDITCTITNHYEIEISVTELLSVNIKQFRAMGACYTVSLSLYHILPRMMRGLEIAQSYE